MRRAAASELVCVAVLSIACASREKDEGLADPASSGVAGEAAAPSIPGGRAWTSDYAEARIDVSSNGNECQVSAEMLDRSALARASIGDVRIYAGYDQVSGDNQDPVVARVDGGVVTWCRHHENDPPDGRALGVAWDGGERAYVVYTVVGGGTDLEKVGWFRSYGGHAAISGGGVKVSVLGQVNARTGELSSATHIIAIKDGNKVNSHVPAGPPSVLADGSVEFRGESAHKAIGADGKKPMLCTDYPFDTTYRFSADLEQLICAECSNCTGNTLPCD